MGIARDPDSGGSGSFPRGARAGEVLPILHRAGNSERLVAEARRFLGRDPEDLDARYYLLMGLCDLGELKEAERQLEELLRLDPESVDTHVAAIRFYLVKRQYKAARRFAESGMRIAPEFAYFHLTAAVVAANQARLHDARIHIARARELDPEDPDTVNLYIRLHAAMEHTTKEAWEHLRKYRDALRLDPDNAALHNSIGDVYLDSLENPAKAEEHYRTALRAEPSNRDYQRDLFNAVARRSIVYRVFSLPSGAFESVRHAGSVLRDHPWVILFILVAFKLLLAYLAWLALATVLLWPGCKVYEWFVVSELRRGSSTPVPLLSLWFRIRRVPMWLRFVAFAAVSCLIWALLFLLAGVSLGEGFGFVGLFLGIHLAVVAGLRVFRSFDAWLSGRGTRNAPPA